MARTTFSSRKQLWLDIGCGKNKQEGCIGMDRRKLDGVDVVHDAESIPYPFADATFTRIIMSHILEHLNPKYHVEILNECWRIMKPKGVLMIAMPYPGSTGFWQDPTHIKSWNEVTAQYFDPKYELYQIYEPSPWKVEANVWHSTGTLEVALRK